MQIWNNIIQTAMLGTDKKAIAESDLNEDFTELITVVNAETTTDKEEKFLQITSAVFNYRQAGFMPIHKENVAMAAAENEVLPYCSTTALHVLQQIFDEDSIGLLKIWLERCADKKQIVPPKMLPVLLQKAAANKSIRNWVSVCGGNRGTWLKQFNKDWDFSAIATDEELWETGNAEQRKQILQQIRTADAAKGLELVQQTWPKENANTRAELLKILSENPSSTDVEWLETLAQEKSQKVKDEALNLLKRIPTSSIVNQYWQALQPVLVLKKEKKLFGLSSETLLQIQLPTTFDEAIFKTGIEKLSNQKQFSDDEFIVYQLLQMVPPSFLESHFQLTPAAIISYFQKGEANQKMLPALLRAIIRFKDKNWAFAIMEHSGSFHPDILPLLPIQQQEKYSNTFFVGNEEAVIRSANERTDEWGMELTGNIFGFMSRNPYYYNRAFYNRQIGSIPAAIANRLQQFSPTEEYYKATWNNQIEHLKKLLSLKTETIQSFS